jgi:hypothetical protein
MLTDSRGAPTAVFLFAHQDDEFGVYQTILNCREQGLRVVCAYFTRSPDAALAAQRDGESRRVLASLGVDERDILFIGSQLAIDDGSLAVNMAAAARWLRPWLAGLGQPRLICTLCWEGGHPDHDALHAVTAYTAGELGLLPLVRQFPLYHADSCIKPFFKVLSPLAQNGPVGHAKIALKNKLRFLKLCLSYPSQSRTWIGLFPFVCLHYLFRGGESLQPVSLERLRQAPHPGALYYERRQFFTWKEMQRRLREWRRATSGEPH